MLKIVKADQEDVPLILKFILDLAKFEKLENEVVATEQSLHESLFGEKKYAEVVFAEVDDEKVGFALFFHNYSTFLGKQGLYLEDLYVDPKKRGLGIGKKLLAYLANLALERNCGRLDWWVLDWNKNAVAFYKSIGAKPMSEWTVFRLEGKSLRHLAKNF